MSVTYLLPSNRPALLATQVIALSGMCRNGDAVTVSTADGMCNAIRDTFAQAKTDILRNCCDDDEYAIDGSFKAIDIMEQDPSIDVLVTGGIKDARGHTKAICVPTGAKYGESLKSVAWYGACGSGLFFRKKAAEDYGLLDYNGAKLIDNYIVLKAIDEGAKVRFARLDTYRHHMSLSDMSPEQYAEFRQEKRALRKSFGIWGVEQRAHEAPPVWDGGIA